MTRAASKASALNDQGWAALWRGGLFGQFCLLILGVWLNAADNLVTVTVMPSVARQIGGYAYFGWATAVFLLGAITAGAGAGAGARRLGLRRAMALAGLIYALGCALGASAPSILVFLAGRLVQGVGGGWIIGLAFVAVGAVFPERMWSRVFAAITGVWGVATLLGPLVGGLFADAGLWRGAFWLFSGQGVVFVLAASVLLPTTAPDAQAHSPPPWRQLLLVAAGVLAIASAGLVSPPALAAALTAAGLFLLVGMLKVDSGAAHPMLPRRAGDLTSAAGAGYLTIFLLQAATTSWSVYGSAFVQALYGASPLVSGYVVSCEALGWTLAALPVAGLGPRWHAPLIRAGALCVGLGLAGLAASLGRAPLLWVSLFSAGIGAGFGLAWAFLNRRILASLGQDERALGSSAIPAVQMIGTAAGAAGAGALGDILGLTQGVGPEAAHGAAPVLVGAFLPLAAGGLAAAIRLTLTDAPSAAADAPAPP